MTITNDLFEAFLRCPTKCFLRAEGALPSGNVFADWLKGEVESYRLETTTRFTKRLSPVVPFSGLLRNIDFISADWRWAVDATVRAQNLESRFHAIERIPSSSGPAQLVPIRFVRAKRPTNVDKLMLAFRQSLSFEYRPLYEDLLKYILRRPLIQIDETPVHLLDRNGYVWVLTSLDSVFFLYRPNREGAFLAELLRPFRGVLVSDFYSVYDSLPCPQQKCLVHFVRDIDDDLLKNPLDVELKSLAQEFSDVLKPIIQSVDRFGLKKRHLQKHKKNVKRFLNSVQSRELNSPIANGYKQRFEKTGAKMFTFLSLQTK